MWSKSTSLLPTAVRGSTWAGLAHTSDWLPTVIEGIFGLQLDGADARDGATRPVDGFNLWPAIATAGESPRAEVITQVSNRFWDTTEQGHGGMAIRVGDMKLLVGYPGDDTWQPVAPLAADAVPFGKSGGVIEHAAHATAPSFPEALRYDADGHALGEGKNTSLCGGTKTQTAYCLYNVVKDPAERHDLAGDPSTAPLAQSMLAKLVAAAKTGPPIAKITDDTKGVDAAICAAMAENGGYVEPADSLHPFPPGPSPPGPSPPGPSPPCPPACRSVLAGPCPLPFKDEDACLECTRQAPDVGAACKPKDRHAYCEGRLARRSMA